MKKPTEGQSDTSLSLSSLSSLSLSLSSRFPPPPSSTTGSSAKVSEELREELREVADGRATSIDPRTHAAWRTWLAALATDAEVVTAAVLAYESLPSTGRDAWMDALEADAETVGVPATALFAPLLAVEQDEERRARIAAHVGDAARKSAPSRAWVGFHGGVRVCAIVSPLYLDFVDVLVCRYHESDGIVEARHHWLVRSIHVQACAGDDVSLAEAPLSLVVEELAHALLADRRRGRAAPQVLTRYSDLFGPDLAPNAADPNAVEKSVDSNPPPSVRAHVPAEGRGHE